MADNSDFTQLPIYRQSLLLGAECGGLSWQSSAAKIKDLAIQIADLEKQLPRPEPVEVQGWYHDGESLCGLWCVGQPDRFSFTKAALDFVAGELANSTMFRFGNTIYGFASVFGPELTAQVFDFFNDALADIQTEHRRYVHQIEDEETGEYVTRYIGLGTGSDEEIDACENEVSPSKCAPDEPGATLISQCWFDPDTFAEIFELLEVRDAAARRVLRGDDQLLPA